MNKIKKDSKIVPPKSTSTLPQKPGNIQSKKILSDPIFKGPYTPSPLSEMKHLIYHHGYLKQKEMIKNYLKKSLCWKFNFSAINSGSRSERKAIRVLRSRLIVKINTNSYTSKSIKFLKGYIRAIHSVRRLSYKIQETTFDGFEYCKIFINKSKCLEYLSLNVIFTSQNLKRIYRYLRYWTNLNTLTLIPKENLRSLIVARSDKKSPIDMFASLIADSYASSNIQHLFLFVVPTALSFVKPILGIEKKIKLKSFGICFKDSLNYETLIKDLTLFISNNVQLEALAIRFGKGGPSGLQEKFQELHDTVNSLKLLRKFEFCGDEQHPIGTILTNLGECVLMTKLELELNCLLKNSMSKITQLAKLTGLKSLSLSLVEFCEFKSFENLITSLKEMINLENFSFSFQAG